MGYEPKPGPLQSTQSRTGRWPPWIVAVRHPRREGAPMSSWTRCWQSIERGQHHLEEHSLCVKQMVGEGRSSSNASFKSVPEGSGVGVQPGDGGSGQPAGQGHHLQGGQGPGAGTQPMSSSVTSGTTNGQNPGMQAAGTMTNGQHPSMQGAGMGTMGIGPTGPCFPCPYPAGMGSGGGGGGAAGPPHGGGPGSGAVPGGAGIYGLVAPKSA